jgi:hypothetical protein
LYYSTVGASIFGSLFLIIQKDITFGSDDYGVVEGKWCIWDKRSWMITAIGNRVLNGGEIVRATIWGEEE